ncbi:FG-GAP repeat domain-containing protein, partial [Candidatus Omnitrophota bacterium]
MGVGWKKISLLFKAIAWVVLICFSWQQLGWADPGYVQDADQPLFDHAGYDVTEIEEALEQQQGEIELRNGIEIFPNDYSAVAEVYEPPVQALPHPAGTLINNIGDVPGLENCLNSNPYIYELLDLPEDGSLTGMGMEQDEDNNTVILDDVINGREFTIWYSVPTEDESVTSEEITDIQLNYATDTKNTVISIKIYGDALCVTTTSSCNDTAGKVSSVRTDYVEIINGTVSPDSALVATTEILAYNSDDTPYTWAQTVYTPKNVTRDTYDKSIYNAEGSLIEYDIITSSWSAYNAFGSYNFDPSPLCTWIISNPSENTSGVSPDTVTRLRIREEENPDNGLPERITIEKLDADGNETGFSDVKFNFVRDAFGNVLFYENQRLFNGIVIEHTAIYTDYDCDGTSRIYTLWTDSVLTADEERDILGWSPREAYEGICEIAQDMHYLEREKLYQIIGSIVFLRDTGEAYYDTCNLMEESLNALSDPEKGLQAIQDEINNIRTNISWGFEGGVPVAGDFDGDNIDDLAVWDEATGNWYIATLGGEVITWGKQWGFVGGVPVAGDFDGDNIDDLAVWDEATGNWYIRTMDGRILSWADISWGFEGGVPVAGDFDGNGTDDMATWNTSDAKWWINTPDHSPLLSSENNNPTEIFNNLSELLQFEHSIKSELESLLLDLSFLEETVALAARQYSTSLDQISDILTGFVENELIDNDEFNSLIGYSSDGLIGILNDRLSVVSNQPYLTEEYSLVEGMFETLQAKMDAVFAEGDSDVFEPMIEDIEASLDKRDISSIRSDATYPELRERRLVSEVAETIGAAERYYDIAYITNSHQRAFSNIVDIYCRSDLSPDAFNSSDDFAEYTIDVDSFKNDMAVFNPATGDWYIKTLEDGKVVAWAEGWGFEGAVPVSGDYNGDGINDLAVWDEATGNWYIKSLWHVKNLASETIAWAEGWGFEGAVPVSGDYNGDGVNDLAVWDTSTGNWYIKTLDGRTLAWAEGWGFSGATPVSGDYDGDGTDDLAVWDEATGNWYIKSLDGRTIAWAEGWGFSGATPVSGDYNGDGTNDLAVWDEATGNWYIKSLDGRTIAWAEGWGFSGATPVSGDYNGDGTDDLAVWDEATGNWYIKSLDGRTIAWAEGWGFSGGIPVTGDYGLSSIGSVDTTSSTGNGEITRYNYNYNRDGSWEVFVENISDGVPQNMGSFVLTHDGQPISYTSPEGRTASYKDYYRDCGEPWYTTIKTYRGLQYLDPDGRLISLAGLDENSHYTGQYTCFSYGDNEQIDTIKLSNGARINYSDACMGIPSLVTQDGYKLDSLEVYAYLNREIAQRNHYAADISSFTACVDYDRFGNQVGSLTFRTYIDKSKSPEYNGNIDSFNEITARYNEACDVYNNNVNELNSLPDICNQIINSYNNTVNRINRTVAQYQSVYNSEYKPVLNEYNALLSIWNEHNGQLGTSTKTVHDNMVARAEILESVGAKLRGISGGINCLRNDLNRYAEELNNIIQIHDDLVAMNNDLIEVMEALNDTVGILIEESNSLLTYGYTFGIEYWRGEYDDQNRLIKAWSWDTPDNLSIEALDDLQCTEWQALEFDSEGRVAQFMQQDLNLSEDGTAVIYQPDTASVFNRRYITDEETGQLLYTDIVNTETEAVQRFDAHGNFLFAMDEASNSCYYDSSGDLQYIVTKDGFAYDVYLDNIVGMDREYAFSSMKPHMGNSLLSRIFNRVSQITGSIIDSMVNFLGSIADALEDNNASFVSDELQRIGLGSMAPDDLASPDAIRRATNALMTLPFSVINCASFVMAVLSEITQGPIGLSLEKATELAIIADSLMGNLFIRGGNIWTSMEAMSNVAASNGRHLAGITVDINGLKAILDTGSPVIAFVDNNHFINVNAISEESVSVTERGIEKDMPLSDFILKWQKSPDTTGYIFYDSSISTGADIIPLTTEEMRAFRGACPEGENGGYYEDYNDDYYYPEDDPPYDYTVNDDTSDVSAYYDESYSRYEVYDTNDSPNDGHEYYEPIDYHGWDYDENYGYADQMYDYDQSWVSSVMGVIGKVFAAPLTILGWLSDLVGLEGAAGFFHEKAYAREKMIRSLGGVVYSLATLDPAAALHYAGQFVEYTILSTGANLIAEALLYGAWDISNKLSVVPLVGSAFASVSNWCSATLGSTNLNYEMLSTPPGLYLAEGTQFVEGRPA